MRSKMEAYVFWRSRLIRMGVRPELVDDLLYRPDDRQTVDDFIKTLWPSAS